MVSIGVNERTVTGMAEYIDREALIEWLKRIPLRDLSDGRGLCRVIMEDDFKKAIKKMPKGIVADVAPVRPGRWLSWDELHGGNTPAKNVLGVFCSECIRQSDSKTHFCHNCGARMDLEVNNVEE